MADPISSWFPSVSENLAGAMSDTKITGAVQPGVSSWSDEDWKTIGGFPISFLYRMDGYNRLANWLRGAAASIQEEAGAAIQRVGDNLVLDLEARGYPEKVDNTYERRGESVGSEYMKSLRANWHFKSRASFGTGRMDEFYFYNDARDRQKREFTRYVLGDGTGNEGTQAYFHRGTWNQEWMPRPILEENMPEFRKGIIKALEEKNLV